MNRKLKIDLHTHPIEALGIESVLNITDEVVKKIVEAIKASNLDGIAITEHRDFNKSWVTYLEIMKNFPEEKLIILPGWERDLEESEQQCLEIFIPIYIRKCFKFFKGKEWFRILAHPGYHNPLNFSDLKNLEREVGEFDAVEEQSKHGLFELAEKIHLLGIPKIRSSDAHKLEEIGLYFIELDSDLMNYYTSR